MTFNDFNLSAEMLVALAEKGFTEPTPIQQLVIPAFLHEKSNIIGHAQTGTGKTAAFAIPMIETIVKDGSVKALVLTPTRELAIQVCEEMHELIGKKRNLRVSVVYGGASIDQQIRNIQRGSDIVVGTPGRVMDLMERKVLDISALSFFVLDEADEMLNMGFVDDIEHILAATNKNKSMLFFSATMPSSILLVAKKYMLSYKVLKVEHKEHTGNLTEQVYFEVREGDKFEVLCRVIDFEPTFYGIVFCKTKVEVEEITRRLKSRSYPVDCLHGDITQYQRSKTLAEFKKKTITILIATDVAARGIDVINLTHVINYCMPQDSESYVHRIGRTGRAGQKGIAMTFVTPKELPKLWIIKRSAHNDIIKKTIPCIRDVIVAKESHLLLSLTDIIKNKDYEAYLALAKKLLNAGLDNAIVLASLLRYEFQEKFLESGYSEIDAIPVKKVFTKPYTSSYARPHRSHGQ